VEASILAIYEDCGFVVNGAKIQQDAVVLWPVQGDFEGRLVPAPDASLARDAYLG
jgi:hypothetical protein